MGGILQESQTSCFESYDQGTILEMFSELLTQPLHVSICGNESLDRSKSSFSRSIALPLGSIIVRLDGRVFKEV